MQHDANTPQRSFTPEQLMNLHIPHDVMARRIDIEMWRAVVETTFEAFAKKKDERTKRLSQLAEHASVMDPDWSKWAAYYTYHDVTIRMPTSTRIDLTTITGHYDDDKHVISLELREPRGIGKRSTDICGEPVSERMPFPSHTSAIPGIVQSFANRAVKEAFSMLPKIPNPDDYIVIENDPGSHVLDR